MQMSRVQVLAQMLTVNRIIFTFQYGVTPEVAGDNEDFSDFPRGGVLMLELKFSLLSLSCFCIVFFSILGDLCETERFLVLGVGFIDRDFMLERVRPVMIISQIGSAYCAKLLFILFLIRG